MLERQKLYQLNHLSRPFQKLMYPLVNNSFLYLLFLISLVICIFLVKTNISSVSNFMYVNIFVWISLEENLKH